MKHHLSKALLFFVLIVGVTAGQASALSYTYDLTRLIHDTSYSSSGWSLGTVTISDDLSQSKNVDVVVQLNSGLNLLSLYLNYAGPALHTNALKINGKKNISFDANDMKAGSYNGMFDIRAPISGSTVTTFSGVISDANVDLDAADFNFLDTGNLFHVAALIGEGNGALSLADSSIWLGDGPSVAPVPEPGTVLLLGTGVLGLAIYGKRRRGTVTDCLCSPHGDRG